MGTAQKNFEMEHTNLLVMIYSLSLKFKICLMQKSQKSLGKLSMRPIFFNPFANQNVVSSSFWTPELNHSTIRISVGGKFIPSRSNGPGSIRF